jgi:plastocyanin
MALVRPWDVGWIVGIAAAVAAGCAGYGGSPPTVPSTTATAPPGTIVIRIVGIDGAMSFSPNPATITPGQPIVWDNADSVTHRVVFNDGEIDTGNIAPGASSAPAGAAAAGPYHCSIHPVMVGMTVKPAPQGSDWFSQMRVPGVLLYDPKNGFVKRDSKTRLRPHE